MNTQPKTAGRPATLLAIFWISLMAYVAIRLGEDATTDPKLAAVVAIAFGAGALTRSAAATLRRPSDFVKTSKTVTDNDLAPANVPSDGTKKWRNAKGQLHRDGGPAVTWADGSQVWYRDGNLHRDGGPAFSGVDGSQEWWRDGKCHRDDGPAVIRADGSQHWYRDGKRHRDGGPARTWANGYQEWYRDGKRQPDPHPPSDKSTCDLAALESGGISRADSTVTTATRSGPCTASVTATADEPLPTHVLCDGTKEWRNAQGHGKLHRDDGPARIWANGSQEWFRDGKRHRDDGPAITWGNGTQAWYRDGKRHRDGGPAIISANGSQEWWRDGVKTSNTVPSDKDLAPTNVRLDGTKEWRNSKGQFHRDDGPAIIYVDGGESWYRDGERHRDDGPAITNADGSQEWWRDGKCHRDGGPAITYADGRQEWYRDDQRQPDPPPTPDKDLPPTRVLSDGTKEWRNAKGYLHRDGGPARIWANGSQEWLRDGKIHRDDGPAVIGVDGAQSWYRDGKIHRDDGPAITFADGRQDWYRDGKIHREDGPARTFADGSQAWYRDGVFIKPSDNVETSKTVPACPPPDKPTCDLAARESGGGTPMADSAATTATTSGPGTASIIATADEPLPPRVFSNGTKEWRNAKGQLHRADGPALIWSSGGQFWYRDGRLHRDDGPAIIWSNGYQEWWRDGERQPDPPPPSDKDLPPTNVLSDGTKEWRNAQGQLHRADGPALTLADGSHFWYRDGKRHRENGPAATWPDGRQEWYRDGKIHRDGGPALTCADGDQEWWLNGERQPDPSPPPDKDLNVLSDGTKEWRNAQGLLHRDGGPAITRADGSQAWYRDGEYHRDGGPARTWADGSQFWYRDGKLHRDDGPAVTNADGSEYWFRDGQCHRDDGPAITKTDGYQSWYRNDKLHRDDGPAITRADGSQFWYRDGNFHRDDGPAVTHADGHQEWWRDGERQPAPPLPPDKDLSPTNAKT